MAEMDMDDKRAKTFRANTIHRHQILSYLFCCYVICFKMKQIINGYLWMKKFGVCESVRESYLAAKWQNKASIVCERLPFRSHEYAITITNSVVHF